MTYRDIRPIHQFTSICQPVEQDTNRAQTVRFTNLFTTSLNRSTEPKIDSYAANRQDWTESTAYTFFCCDIPLIYESTIVHVVVGQCELPIMRFMFYACL